MQADPTVFGTFVAFLLAGTPFLLGCLLLFIMVAVLESIDGRSK